MIAFLKRYALAGASGVLLSLAFPAWHLHYLAWVALIPLLWRAAAEGPVRACAQFFVAGWVFHSLVLQWLMANIMWAGGFAIVGYQLLCVALALFWGALGLLWAMAHRRHKLVGGAALLAALWVAMEWAQANLLTGFGWTALAYSQGGNLPLLQWAALGGFSCVSFLIVLVNALAALALREPQARLLRLGGVAAVVLAGHGIGYLLLGKPDYGTEPYRVGIIQTNFAQEMKWDWEYQEEMVANAARKSARLAQFEPVELLVWPEATVMRSFDDPAMLDLLANAVRQTGISVAGADPAAEDVPGIPLLTGAVRDVKGKSFNSSVLIGPDGQVAGYYDKVHLAPFGEYVPLEAYLPFVSQVVPGGVAPGDAQKVLPTSGRTLGPLICFEVLFAPMAENLRTMGADLLVVVTNLAWFGMSNAVPQELELARLRAIETRLPLIHAANTGISGVFDPFGRFTPVNGHIDPMDHFRIIEDDAMNRQFLHGHRRVGALPVAKPGARPLPYGPVVFPWAAAGFAALLLLAALLRPERPPAPPQPVMMPYPGMPYPGMPVPPGAPGMYPPAAQAPYPPQGGPGVQ